jgi:hypothetical protein
MTIRNKRICYLGARALACALLFGLTTAAVQPKLAFKGAEGAGRFAAGGRGGKVIHVSNLNDNGPGSLRAAIEADYPRIVKFDVAGTIRLKSPLVIRNSRITITGEDAPGAGIALADNGLIVSADDVIIRYIRSRLGDVSRVESDAISIASGRRIILDHVSASWSVDETLSVSARYNDPDSGIYDVTVQWSIISESLRKSSHTKGDHGYGSLIRGGRGSRFSFHHNLWAHHVARMPRPGNYSAIADDPVGPMIEFVGNVFYNWGGKAAGYNADTNSAASYAFIDNCYFSGPDSKGRKIFNEENPHARSWFYGNSMDGLVPQDQQSLLIGLWNPMPVAPNIPDITSQPATLGCKTVLQHAGASSARDSVDQRVVADVENRTGSIIDSQSDVGGWPDLAKGAK